MRKLFTGFIAAWLAIGTTFGAVPVIYTGEADMQGLPIDHPHGREQWHIAAKAGNTGKVILYTFYGTNVLDATAYTVTFHAGPTRQAAGQVEIACDSYSDRIEFQFSTNDLPYAFGVGANDRAWYSALKFVSGNNVVSQPEGLLSCYGAPEVDGGAINFHYSINWSLYNYSQTTNEGPYRFAAGWIGSTNADGSVNISSAATTNAIPYLKHLGTNYATSGSALTVSGTAISRGGANHLVFTDDDTTYTAGDYILLAGSVFSATGLWDNVTAAATNALVAAATNDCSTRMGLTEAATNDLNTRMCLVELATNAIESDLTIISTATNDLDDRLELAEAATNDLSTSMGLAEAATNAIESDLTIISTATNDLDDRLELAEAATNDLTTRVGLAETATNNLMPLSQAVAGSYLSGLVTSPSIVAGSIGTTQLNLTQLDDRYITSATDTSRFDQITVADLDLYSANASGFTVDYIYTGQVATTVAWTQAVTSVTGAVYKINFYKIGSDGTATLAYADETLSATAAGEHTAYETAWGGETQAILTLYGDALAHCNASNVQVRAYTNGDVTVADRLAAAGPFYLGGTNVGDNIADHKDRVVLLEGATNANLGRIEILETVTTVTGGVARADIDMGSYLVDGEKFGQNAGLAASGNGNIYLGSSAGLSSAGSTNVIMGKGAGFSLDGDQNLVSGWRAGDQATLSNSVCLGPWAGFDSDGMRQIFIHSYLSDPSGGDATNSIIWGDIPNTNLHLGMGGGNVYVRGTLNGVGSGLSGVDATTVDGIDGADITVTGGHARAAIDMDGFDITDTGTLTPNSTAETVGTSNDPYGAVYVLSNSVYYKLADGTLATLGTGSGTDAVLRVTHQGIPQELRGTNWFQTTATVHNSEYLGGTVADDWCTDAERAESTNALAAIAHSGSADDLALSAAWTNGVRAAQTNDGAGTWGSISGTLADQSDLNTELTNRYTKAEADAADDAGTDDQTLPEVLAQDNDANGLIITNYGTPSAADHVIDKGYADATYLDIESDPYALHVSGGNNVMGQDIDFDDTSGLTGVGYIKLGTNASWIEDQDGTQITNFTSMASDSNTAHILTSAGVMDTAAAEGWATDLTNDAIASDADVLAVSGLVTNDGSGYTLGLDTNSTAGAVGTTNAFTADGLVDIGALLGNAGSDVYWALKSSADQEDLNDDTYHDVSFDIIKGSSGVTIDTNSYTVTLPAGVYLAQMQARIDECDATTGFPEWTLSAAAGSLVWITPSSYRRKNTDYMLNIDTFSASFMIQVTNGVAVKAQFRHSDANDDVDVDSQYSGFIGFRVAE